MTRSVLGVALSLLLPAVPVCSQSVTVRSGEHDTFTRLTLTLPSETQWSITRGNRGATLAIDAPDIVFNTSQAFNRIPRTRLSGLSQSGPGDPLNMQFGCDCEIDWFLQSGSLLVIDVQNEAPKDQTRLPLPIPVNGQAYRFGGLASPSLNWTQDTVRNMPEAPLEIRAEPNLPADPDQPDSPGAGRMEVGLNISEQRLLAQIGRAANQGLLTPIEPANPNRQQMGAAEPGMPAAQTLPINVTAETVIDRDLVGVAGSLSADLIEQVCLPSDQLSISSWADDRDLSEQISQHRSQLFGEFDSLDEKMTLVLARTYLHFGFGAEAIDTVQLLSPSDEKTAVLIRMATILDDIPPTGSDPFSDQQHCDGNVALWSVLSEGLLTREANKHAVQQAFSRLPLHLRTHLGPRLSEIMTTSGDLDLATAILRAIDRSETVSAPGQNFTDGLIAVTGGDVEHASEVMEQVVDNDSEYSPRALIELVDLHLSERTALDPGLTDLAAAYSSELGKSALGPDLRRAHSISLALIGRFDDSLEIVSKISGMDGRENRVMATNHVLAILTENADDVSFLKHALSRLGQMKSEAPPELNEQMATRLLDLGFASEAMDLVSAQGTGPVSVDRRLIRAKAALATNRPHRALVELLGVSHTEAAQLRAQAMWQNGDFEMAGQVLQGTGHVEEANRGFWHGDSWEDIPEADGSVYADVAELSKQIGRDSVDTNDMPPLASARALLADSEAVRGEIQALLGFTRPDIETE